MKLPLQFCLALFFCGQLAGCTTATKSSDTTSVIGSSLDPDLTRQMAEVILDCQKIKPGMTRADLLKVFTTEGGLSTEAWQTFVYRRCPYIKVDVGFNISNPPPKTSDWPLTDTIRTVSKPYLEWSISD